MVVERKNNTYLKENIEVFFFKTMSKCPKIFLGKQYLRHLSS